MNFKELSLFNKFIVIINGLLGPVFIFKSGDFLLSHSRLWGGQNLFDFFSALAALLGSSAIVFNMTGIFLEPFVFKHPKPLFEKIRSVSRGASLIFGIYLLVAATIGIIFSFGLPAGEGPGFLIGAVLWAVMFFISGCIILGAIIKYR
ncbi:MAG: hypothetical protein AAB019_10730 [Planctomycetota bacterium]